MFRLGGSKTKNGQKSRRAKLANEQNEYSFRRNRTLTGSTSNKVNPTAKGLAQLKTQRLKTHELHLIRKKIIRVLLIVFLLANFVGSIKIDYSKVKSKPDVSSYSKSIEAYFLGRPMQRFGFMLDQQQLEDYMLNKHGELKAFEVHRYWYGGVSSFVASFRKPILVWQVADQKLYVDSEGVPFLFDNYKSSPVSVKDDSGIVPEKGESIASQRFIKFLGKTVGAVNKGEKGRVVEIIIPSSAREIDLKLEGRGYIIKTHIDRDPLQQAEDIINALAYLDSKNIVPQYVDVRVAGKAFYK